MIHTLRKALTKPKNGLKMFSAVKPEGFYSVNPYTKQEMHYIPFSSHEKIKAQIEQLSNPTTPPLDMQKLRKL